LTLRVFLRGTTRAFTQGTVLRTTVPVVSGRATTPQERPCGLTLRDSYAALRKHLRKVVLSGRCLFTFWLQGQKRIFCRVAAGGRSAGPTAAYKKLHRSRGGSHIQPWWYKSSIPPRLALSTGLSWVLTYSTHRCTSSSLVDNIPRGVRHVV
jgi:hypothetical protein